MSENNTTQTKKEEKNQAVSKKANSKKWWIGALALVLVLAIGGAVFNTLTQKTSNSKADSVNQSNNQSCKIIGNNKTCVNGVTTDNKNTRPLRNPRSPRTINSRSLIQPQPAIEKPETNPYTGEKQ
jgi:uncharacterized protein HemX